MPLSEAKVSEVYNLVKNKYERNGHLNRFIHIVGVFNMASYLAKKYNVNIFKAQLAALIHDYFKYESIEEMKEYLKDSKLIEECEECPVLFHAYSSAKAVKDIFNIEDDEIYYAVKYHVFGRLKMTKLEEIILISDYTEENRTYESCVKARKILLDNKLNEAIYLSTKDTIDFVTKKGEKPHPIQLKILKQYKEKI